MQNSSYNDSWGQDSDDDLPTDNSSIGTGQSSIWGNLSSAGSVAQAGPQIYTFYSGMRMIQLHIPGATGTFKLECNAYYQNPERYPHAPPIPSAAFFATASTWAEIGNKTLDWAENLGILTKQMQEWIKGCQPA